MGVKRSEGWICGGVKDECAYVRREEGWVLRKRGEEWACICG